MTQNDDTIFTTEEWLRGYVYGQETLIAWLEKCISGEVQKKGKLSSPALEKIRDFIIDHR